MSSKDIVTSTQGFLYHKVGGSMILFTFRSRGDRSVTRNPRNYSKTRITLNTYRTNMREVRAWRGATAERICLFFPLPVAVNVKDNKTETPGVR